MMSAIGRQPVPHSSVADDGAWLVVRSTTHLDGMLEPGDENSRSAVRATRCHGSGHPVGALVSEDACRARSASARRGGSGRSLSDGFVRRDSGSSTFRSPSRRETGDLGSCNRKRKRDQNGGGMGRSTNSRRPQSPSVVGKCHAATVPRKFCSKGVIGLGLWRTCRKLGSNVGPGDPRSAGAKTCSLLARRTACQDQCSNERQEVHPNEAVPFAASTVPVCHRGPSVRVMPRAGRARRGRRSGGGRVPR